MEKMLVMLKKYNYLVNKPVLEVAVYLKLGFETNKEQLEQCSNGIKIKEMSSALEKFITEYFKN